MMWSRRLALLLCVAAAGQGAHAQSPPAPPRAGAALSDRDRADLARIEAYLNGLRTLRARFRQIAHDGSIATGTAWIVRPGRMRVEYDPPEPLLLVADAGQFLIYDRELRSPTTLPLSQTPLAVLLAREVRLSGEVTVTALQRGAAGLQITLVRSAAPHEGRLTLLFQPEPLQLREWVVTDVQGRTTRVILSHMETGLSVPAALFQFNDPRFFEPGGAAAPVGSGK